MTGTQHPLGSRVREIREERGIKQASLARALGIPPQTLANYELGPNRFPAELLPRVAVALNATYEELLGPQPVRSTRAVHAGEPRDTTRRDRIARAIVERLTERLTLEELEALDEMAGVIVRLRARVNREEHTEQGALAEAS